MSAIPQTYKCGPGYGARGQRAYELRVSGKTWAEIMAVENANSESAVTNTARKYARARGLKWPVHIARPATAAPKAEAPVTQALRETQKSAYDLRTSGKKWREIAEATGYSFPSHAVAGAKRHAEREKLPWPVPT